MAETATATPLELSLRAVPSCVRDVREAAAGAARELGMSKRVVEDIRLCVSEAVTNVVRHAYVGEVGVVNVRFERLGRGVLVVVRDFGSGWTTPGTRSRELGGFGWRLIRALADRTTVTSTSADGTRVAMSFGTRSPEVAPRPAAASAHASDP